MNIVPTVKRHIAYPLPDHKPRAGEVPFRPGDVGRAYGYPHLPVPAGATVPLLCYIELGGGYVASDFTRAASDGGYPPPVVSFVGVRGGSNAPGSDADGEVALDGQVGAAVFSLMTGLAAKVVFFFAPNSDSGFAGAIGAAAAAIKANNGLGTISISWGGPEDSWGGGVATMEAALAAAWSAGIPVTVASGDNGSSDGESGNHADYPSSSVYAIGCGGTTMTYAAGVLTEHVWNVGGGAGGGGVSALFNAPTFQKGFLPSGITARGVPDCCGNADPNTGYLVYINGQASPIGGTSAVAPLVAAYLAGVQCAAQRPTGKATATFYLNEPAFNDVTQGNNGAFSATRGYDLASGLGSINGAKMTTVLLGAAPPVVLPPVNPPVVQPPVIQPPATPAFTLDFGQAVKQGQRWCNVARQPIAKTRYNCYPAPAGSFDPAAATADVTVDAAEPR